MKMAPMTTLLGLVLLFTPCVATVNNAETGKRTISQVVSLLESMLQASKDEGADERKLFAKYKCYCDTNTAEKTATVDEQTELISILESKIEQLQSSTGVLSEQVAKLDADMASNEASRDTAETLRRKQNKDFLALEADLEQAISQMKAAIKTLADIGADQTSAEAAADHKFAMAGYGGSLLKVKTSVKAAMIAAAALDNEVPQEKKVVLESFIQAPFTGTYTAQSGEVVGILKDMRDTFEANLDEAIATEKKEAAAHKKFMDIQLKSYNEMKKSFTQKQGKLGDNDGDLSTKKTQLENAEQAKADAEQFLEELTEMCDKKADEYKQRVALRTNEDAAIAEAISILNSDAAFATFGSVDATSTGGTGARFIQLRAMHKRVRSHAQGDDEARKAVSKFLAPNAAKSLRVARVASMIQAENPFSVVIKEISKMLDIIKKEAKADAEQKSWCADEREKHNGIVADKKKEITSLNGEIDDLEAKIDDPIEGLKKQISDDEVSLEENDKDQKEETAQRTEENGSYQKDIAGLVEAERLLEKAIKVLSAYYETISLVQKGKGKYTPPDAPDTWSAGENQADGAYAGQGGNKAINMLEFILSETQKEEQQAHDFEKDAQHAFEDSMTTLTSDEKDLRENLAKLNVELTEAELALEGAKKLLKVTVEEKETSEAYLAKIKRGCDWINKEYDGRETARADETKALKNARTIIKGTPAYTNAVEAQRQEDLGDCKDVCNDEGTGHAKCKACLAKTSVPGYCAGHPTTTGC